jgi:hypothetical protein
MCDSHNSPFSCELLGEYRGEDCFEIKYGRSRGRGREVEDVRSRFWELRGLSEGSRRGIGVNEEGIFAWKKGRPTVHWLF